MNLAKCDKCDKVAVWFYGSDDDRKYCDDCVHRGCSCNEDEFGVESLDEHGRLYPCCDYLYFEDGIDLDAPLLTEEQEKQLIELWQKFNSSEITEEEFEIQRKKILAI